MFRSAIVLVIAEGKLLGGGRGGESATPKVRFGRARAILAWQNARKLIKMI